VFVLSSRNEASPLVYREAGLMRKPAIGATETGAQAIILNEKTGLLFKNNDAQDLANQIERLLDNPEWARELGNNAYQHIIKNFLPEAIFEKYKELYATLQR
jgi:glycosyltransferase involved in cell wall biosynthesis